VFPEEANVDAGQLSVLAPLGTAILGYRAGDTFQWKVPAGVRNLKILEVLFQPEANGRYTD
jgi:regulator of nucleoside diphosphate kinase